MTERDRPDQTMIVTGMSGAGKSTALKTLEDIGWEVIDNLPLTLLERLLASGQNEDTKQTRPLAIGIDSRTRGFDAHALVNRMKRIGDQHDSDQHSSTTVLFLDCAGNELERRYSETRRRHPLAPDRAASDGIARERELLAPLRRWAEHVIDTSSLNSNDLRLELRNRFEVADGGEPTLSIMSFGYSRGLPRNADLVFDMRFLRNPHWNLALRPLTGLDEPVGNDIRSDPAYSDAVSRIEDLLVVLLPRYRAVGKAYVTIAFGCTGGRHRSVHVSERVASRLRDSGFSPTVYHRDLTFDASQGGDVRAGQDMTGPNMTGQGEQE